MNVRWTRIIAAGTVLVALSWAVGPAAVDLTRALSAAFFVALALRLSKSDLGPAAAPWRRLAYGGAIALSAAAIRLAEGTIRGIDYPFPSVADLVYYAGYLTLLSGGFMFVRARTVERRPEDRLDTWIAIVLSGLLIYEYVLSGYLHDSTVDLLSRLTNLGYSALVVGLIGSAARVSFGPGERNGSYYLLAGSCGLIVVNDILTLLDTVGKTWAQPAGSIAGSLAFFFAAAAIAHPGASRLADRPEHRKAKLTQRRILLLLIALLVGPSVMLLRGVGASLIDQSVVMLGAGLLSVFVLARMVQLVRAREQWADREQALRDLGSALVAATTRDEAFDSAAHLLHSIVGPPAKTRVTVYEALPGGDLFAVHAKGIHAGSVAGATLAREQLPRSIAVALEGADAGIVELVEPIEAVPADGLVFQAAAPVVSRQDAAALLLVTSPDLIARENVATLSSVGRQLGLALDSLLLNEQVHQRRSNRRFQALVENSSDVVMVLGEAGLVTFVSPTVRRLLGRSEDQVLDHAVLDLVHRPDQVHVRRLLAAPNSAQGTHSNVEVRLLHGSGELRWFEVEARDLSAEEEVQGVVVTCSDISDRKRAEAQMLRSEARFRLMVQNSSDVVAIIDDNSLVTYISPSIESMLGFPPHEVLGRNVFELLSVTDAERVRSLEVAELDGTTIDVRVQARDGSIRSVEVVITDMRHQAEVDGIVLNIRDVTDRKSLEDEMRHQALHDDLTGLANRTLFVERVNDAVRSPKRNGEVVAVLFIDLDDFKLINDSLGHLIGDQVLVSVADRIQQCLRLSDVASRLGGDEFAVLLSGIYGATEVFEVAERIRESLRVPVQVGEQEFPLSASLGIASDLDGTRSGEDLLRSADLAMYQAKQQGKDRIELFEDHMEASAFEELEIKTALARAIENDEFVLHYQPIIDMATSQIRGVEALIRWEDPNRGMVSPASFIPVAEESGLIRPIGMWVARQAATDLARWRDLGFDIYCSVNVSGRQMEEDDFATKFIQQIAESGVDLGSIVVELTESVLAARGVSEVFDRFHEVGFRIALDDFGTGYSAFQYLQSFDIDLIKIDRSFVQAMNTEADAGVVEAVLDVARRIDAKTVAEGIEDTTELRALKQLGVELGQGYYFSRPIEAAKMLKLLEDELVGDMPAKAQGA